jgi:hypothetical protein
MLGITQGSTFDIYRPETTSFSEEKNVLGRARVTQVNISDAECEMMGEFTAIPKQSRVVERLHNFQSEPLKILFSGEWRGSSLARIKQQVVEQWQLTSTTDSGAHLVLKAEHDSIYLSRGADPRIILYSVPIDSNRTMKQLEKQLTAWSKWFNVLQLRNDNSPLAVDVSLGAHQSNHTTQDNDFQPVRLFTEGERVEINITNRSERPVYCYIIYLQESGAISVLHLGELKEMPTNANESILPGKSWKGVLETFVEGKGNINRDILKFFVTTDPQVNLQFLPHTAPETTAGGHALEKIFDLNSRGVKAGHSPAPLDSWLVIERTLTVKKK